MSGPDHASESSSRRLRALEAENRELRERLRAPQGVAGADDREWLSLALDAARLGIWSWTIGSNAVHWSPRVEELFGLPPGGFAGTYAAYRDLIHPDDRARVQGVVERALADGEDYYRVVHRVAPAAAAGRWLEGFGRIHRDAHGAPVRLVGAVMDVTEQRGAIDALRESEARLRSAAQSLPFTFWMRDAAGLLVLQNPISVAQWGDLIGTPLEAMALPGHLLDLARASLAKVMAGEMVDVEVAIDIPGGQRHLRSIMAPVRDQGAIRGVLGVDIDISERRRMEEHLLQAAKEESIGRLAGGVAHDFNNLLTAILGCAELAERAAASGDPARSHLRRIREAAERGARLTGQLLGFARRQVIQPRTFDLNALVRRIGDLLPMLLGELIAIDLRLAPRLRPVSADPSQFEQILLNLAANARDAMPAGGRFAIATAETTLDADAARAHGDLAPGDYIVLTVSDTGVGMEAEVQRRLFEPFFTTKPIGKGTGLGLAMCQGVVRQSRGRIAVRSALGQGAVFTILLPVAVVAETASHGAVAPADVDADPTGTETILLVEDEPAIRELLHNILAGLGYVVHSAGDGQAALDVARDCPHLDLLVTDLMMPRLGGRELAERLRHERPGLRVLFASGYSGDAIGSAARQPWADFIQKPFQPAELARRIRTLIDAPA